MGDHEELSGIMPNGLVPNVVSASRVLDRSRWYKAEERIEELIACIQPNKLSEERRNAVADYVQRLIMKCFSCQVFTFGSVPLKTYLPDGDIDLTAFSKNQNLKDTWATEVRDILENEEKNENAEFRVKEVQYIQAEVKLVKCLVENIVVDISFNQLGGLCTLCFLEEVDHLINQNHLFKRSIILIKAWCYYESRILGAHHGLISTYALETLVLYIFHVFNNSFSGPLEVLYRFLEFFSKFDWDNFCVSLWGPVPITSLPDMTAEPPRMDNGELLLNKLFLDACSSVYAVFPGSQENQGQPFVSKHFNVVDPLRTNNNLGRSVSKGNFFRIRSAFAFGAKRLARLLECPEENLITELNQFFANTWERHGSGCRPDTPSVPLCLNPKVLDTSENSKSYSNSKKKNNLGEETRASNAPQRGYSSLETMTRSNDALANSRAQNQRNHGNLTNLKIPNQVARSISSIESAHTGKDPKSSKTAYPINGIHGRYQFVRTRSSPELTDTSNDVTLSGRRNRMPDGKNQVASKPEYSRRKNAGLETSSGTHSTRSSVDDPSSAYHQSPEAAPNSGLGMTKEQLAPDVIDSRERQQEEQDHVNMMAASSKLHTLGGQFQMPMIPSHLSPSVLASMGYQKNFVGVLPANIPFVGPWGPHIQFPQSMLSSPVSNYSPSLPNTEELVASVNQNLDLRDPNQEDSNYHGFWHNNDSEGVSSDNGGSHIPPHFDDVILTNNLQASSSRTSESSWGSSTVKTSKTVRERRNRKAPPPISPSAYGKENGWQYEDHGSSLADDEGSDWVSLSTMDNELEEIPISPMRVNSGSSRQRGVENSGVVPFAFYLTGPPVPFLTMLPVYNVPVENREEGLDSEEGLDRVVTVEPSQQLDILHSDFNSHWQNLQFGRFCQSPRFPGGPVMHPPGMVPPVYLQGQFPFEGPGRPISPNSNIFNQLMSYGPRLIPVSAPLQSGTIRPPNSYQRYGDEIPRYRGGTGTYLPKNSLRERESSSPSPSPRHHNRGNYNYRNDHHHHHHHHHHHSEREGNWNNNHPRPRHSGRGYNRSHVDKPSPRSDRDNQQERPWAEPPYRPNVTPNMGYGVRPAGPNVVMVYPSTEQLEFGTLGQGQYEGEGRGRSRGVYNEERRFRGGSSPSHSSPDQPSSPRYKR